MITAAAWPFFQVALDDERTHRMPDQDRRHRHAGDHLGDVGQRNGRGRSCRGARARAGAVAREVDGVAVVAQRVEVGHEIHIPAAAMDIAAMHEDQRRVAVVLLRGAMQGMQFAVCKVSPS
jgi:hypothetical protein